MDVLDCCLLVGLLLISQCILGWMCWIVAVGCLFPSVSWGWMCWIVVGWLLISQCILGMDVLDCCWLVGCLFPSVSWGWMCWIVVGWLLISQGILGMDVLDCCWLAAYFPVYPGDGCAGLLYVLSLWDRGCRSNFLSHPVTVP